MTDMPEVLCWAAGVADGAGQPSWMPEWTICPVSVPEFEMERAKMGLGRFHLMDKVFFETGLRASSCSASFSAR